MPCDKLKIFDKSATAALRVLLAGAMLSISPLAALAADAHIHASFAGVYVTRAPKTAPTMSVSLRRGWISHGYTGSRSGIHHLVWTLARRWTPDQGHLYCSRR